MCGAELRPLPEDVRRVARVLLEHGHAQAPALLEQSARTAQQAADARGVALGQIAKSISGTDVEAKVIDDALDLAAADPY